VLGGCTGVVSDKPDDSGAAVETDSGYTFIGTTYNPPDTGYTTPGTPPWDSETGVVHTTGETGGDTGAPVGSDTGGSVGDSGYTYIGTPAGDTGYGTTGTGTSTSPSSVRAPRPSRLGALPKPGSR
jgi:hypothetical protein